MDTASGLHVKLGRMRHEIGRLELGGAAFWRVRCSLRYPTVVEPEMVWEGRVICARVSRGIYVRRHVDRSSWNNFA